MFFYAVKLYSVFQILVFHKFLEPSRSFKVDSHNLDSDVRCAIMERLLYYGFKINSMLNNSS